MAVAALWLASCASVPQTTSPQTVLSSGSATVPTMIADAADIEWTIDRYVRMDRRALERSASDGSVSAALFATLNREGNASELLLEAMETASGADGAERLLAILLDQLIANHRWSEVIEVAERFDPQNEAIAYARPYANWPKAGVSYGAKEFVEVPFDGLYISAKLDGQPIKIAFDTGAPGVGVHHDFLDMLQTDRTAPQRYAYPAFDLTVERYHALIGELTIGDIRLTNIAATVARPPSEDELAKFEAMERNTGRHDIIMGLDALRPYFAVIEFDYNRDVVRFIRRDASPRSDANMIMGDGRKPMVRLRSQNRTSNVYVDTGSYGHLLGQGAFETSDCLASRVMKAPWREIEEHRVRIAFGEQVPIEAWAQPRSLVKEDRWDITGYIGNPRSGIYKLDLEDGNFALLDYDSSGLDSLWPIASRSEGTCQPPLPMPVEGLIIPVPK
ncbi:MAG: retropepsin-like aspartic protease [Pontixanthobacter sp.]